MKTYEVTYTITTVVYADSGAKAVAESTDILLNADSGVADFVITSIKSTKVVDSTDLEMSI